MLCSLDAAKAIIYLSRGRAKFNIVLAGFSDWGVFPGQDMMLYSHINRNPARVQPNSVVRINGIWKASEDRPANLSQI